MSDYQYSTLLGSIWLAIAWSADGWPATFAACVAIFLFVIGWVIAGLRHWKIR